MDSQTTFCPNPDGPAKGHTGTGNIVIHSREHFRYQCKECGQTFTATKGTPFYRLRHEARRTATIEDGMWLVTLYNFCTPHESLRGRRATTESRWQECTPAMAAGITDHCWSVKELLSYRVRPPRWRPPKRRGRVSQAMKLKIRQWCT